MQSFLRHWHGNGSIRLVRNFSKKIPSSKSSASKTAKNRQEQMEGLLDVALHSPPLHGLEMKVRSTASVVEKATTNMTKKEAIITTTLIDKMQQLDNHQEVVLLWETMKQKSPSSLTSEMLSLFVKSAEIMKRPQLIITMTEFAMNCDVPLSDMNKLCFIQACRTLAADHNKNENSSWLKAVGMLESTSFGKKDIAAPFSSGHPLDTGNDTSILMEMIEETVQACSDSGKWRNCLDIIEKSLKLKLTLTEKIVSSTILCCTKEKNGISPAYTLFKFASSSQGNVPRLSMRVYTALLQGLARESYLDRYEVVWKQMNVDKIPRGDLAYASRVEVLSLSRLAGTMGSNMGGVTGGGMIMSMGSPVGRIGGGYNATATATSSSLSSSTTTTTTRNLEEAERVLREALRSMKRPKLTYHALYLAYLKAGPMYMHKAQQLVTEMKERGIHPPDQIEADYHLIGLCKLGLFKEALESLKHYLGEQGSKEIGQKEMGQQEIGMKEKGQKDVHDIMSSREMSNNERHERNEKHITSSSMPPLSTVTSTVPSMVVSDHAWLSLFRGSLAKGHVDVAVEVYHLANKTAKTNSNHNHSSKHNHSSDHSNSSHHHSSSSIRHGGHTMAGRLDQDTCLSMLVTAMGEQGRWHEAIKLVDDALVITSSNHHHSHPHHHNHNNHNHNQQVQYRGIVSNDGCNGVSNSVRTLLRIMCKGSIIVPSTSSSLSSSSSSSSSSLSSDSEPSRSPHNFANSPLNLIDHALQIHRNLLVRIRLHQQQPQPQHQPQQSQSLPQQSQSLPQQPQQTQHSTLSGGFGSASGSGLAPRGMGLATGSGLEIFVSKVSQDLIQHLAMAHHWDEVVGVLDDVHTAMRQNRDHQQQQQQHQQLHQQINQNKNSHNHNNGGGSNGTKANTIDPRQRRSHHPFNQGPLLALLYTVAVRHTALPHNVTLSKGQAIRLMEHQRHHGVRPYWSCVRYALKAMYVDEQWESLLDLFSVRRETMEYHPAEEKAYLRALRACKELHRWEESLELLHDLLLEQDVYGMNHTDTTTMATAISTTTIASSSSSSSSSSHINASNLSNTTTSTATTATTVAVTTTMLQSIFELTLETLVAAGQREMIQQVLKIMNERDVPPTANITRIDLLYSPKTLPKDQFDRLTAIAAHKILGVDEPPMKSFGDDVMRGLGGDGRLEGDSHVSPTVPAQGTVSEGSTKTMRGKKGTTGGTPLRG